MKNSGIFQVLKKEDKYRIVYIERGELLVVYPNEFQFYEAAKDYVKGNKEELDKVVTAKKEAEQKRREQEEAERKAKEEAEKAKQEEKEKKKEERKKKNQERLEKVKTFWGKGWVKFASGFLVAVMLLTGGHFAGKGISNAIKNRDSKKPTTSQTGSTNSTESVKDDMENTMTYEEMYNTENFEKLVTEFVKPYADNKVSINTEDLLKFTSIINIDRLAEENPELAKDLFSAQTAEEYLNDAAKTIGVTYMYNHTMWEKDKNTNNFIWLSNSIPEGDPQKEKMVELEGYVTKIAKASAEENKDEVNKLTLELIESLTLPDENLNALDDGVEFGAQVYFALINNSIARNYLNEECRDYFNTRSSSEQNVSNIFTIYNKCITDAKVRTK